MPNNCMGHVLISGLTEEQKKRISRWAKNGCLCSMIIPYTKEVKEDTKNEEMYYEELEKLKKTKGPTKEEDEKLKQKYPYKGLRYNWRVDNWGSKWELCDCAVFPGGFGDDLELQFWTAWSPQIPVFQKLSKKYHCSVSYDYDEPGCFFSGSYKWIDGEEMYREEYDDPYYGEGEVCSKCGLVFDGTNEEDWSNLDLHICYDCGHKGTGHE